MVLDRIEDYARHGIEPPEAELREEYLALRGEAAQGRPRQEHSGASRCGGEGVEGVQGLARQTPSLAGDRAQARRRAGGGAVCGASGRRPQKNQKGTLSAEDAEAARALADKAKALAQRWAKEGRDEDTRAAWIQEASNVMLAVDTLRQRRLELMPQSEEPPSNDGDDSRRRPLAAPAPGQRDQFPRPGKPRRAMPLGSRVCSPGPRPP